MKTLEQRQKELAEFAARVAVRHPLSIVSLSGHGGPWVPVHIKWINKEGECAGQGTTEALVAA